jgi:hypothetical protein
MKAKNGILLGLVLLLSTSVFGQTYDYLDRNMIKATVNSDGTLFNSIIGGEYSPGFEVPNGLGIHSIFYAGLFIGGIDENSVLRLSGYYFGDKDFVYGPVADSYSGEEYKSKYNRVWVVNLSDLEYHYYHYDDAGYLMPEAIENWPAHGNTLNGEASDLAPYYDVNKNGVYDPQNGDIPMIRGDQAIYFIANDAGGQQATGGLKTGFEVHGMVYCLNPSVGSVLQQTVFVNYRLINRSSHDFDNFYTGMMCDFDLGNITNDCVGSDSVLNMMYVYNSVKVDSVNSNYNINGYPYSPAQGAMILSHSASSVYGIDTNNDSDADYYNNLLVPEPMINPEGNFLTSFILSGIPEESEGWFMTDTDTSGGGYYAPRMMLSSGPYNINSGSQICFDYAFPFAIDYEGSNMESIAFLREKAESLQSWFNSQEFACLGASLGVSPFNTNSDFVAIFPNPSDGIINIGLSEDFHGKANVYVLSADGKTILDFETSNLENSISISQPGLYLIVVKYGNRQVVKRVSVL